ncbi:hypothetical protein [Streptomyces sp. XY332]|uniref:hypothetical protein n=1 Tax=Streptomyces sp. XY332 TaxID=1415561 RepID=UPI0018FE0C3F|nr:hypothetical protein [Streptomyces sp. XY332]
MEIVKNMQLSLPAARRRGPLDFPLRRLPPRPADPDPATVTPGAFRSPSGATGIGQNGSVYTCKGPGQDRWRR